MLLYKEVEALSRENHKDLKIKAAENAEFASNIHWTPIAGSEFFAIARHYPIVFIKTDAEDNASEIVPIALLGLQSDTNDFLDESKKWEAGIYVPAFIRRYPFVLAHASAQEDDFAVCFDRAYPGFSNESGEALFNFDGTNSLFLTDAIQFMEGFRIEMQRTHEFVKLLQKYELLETKSAEIKSSSGETFRVQDFLVIDEEKFKNIATYKITDLHKHGYLGWIFAHFISLGNLPSLFDRYLARQLKR